jgi:His/Glu/Gln/Arg/opine family amino acid ABC transporter permease subunit
MPLDFSSVIKAWPVLAQGTLTTLLLTASVLAVATPVGILVAIGRDSTHRLVSTPLYIASWICRGIPPLILLLIAFFIPAEFGLALPPFAAAVLGLALYLAFYFGEIFRGGLASISPSQRHAADALGLSPFHVLRRITLPQILPAIMPSYVSQSSSLLKASALASAVSVRELTSAGKGLYSVTFQPLETLLVVAAIYALFSALMFALQKFVENRFAGRR